MFQIDRCITNIFLKIILPFFSHKQFGKGSGRKCVVITPQQAN